MMVWFMLICLFLLPWPGHGQGPIVDTLYGQVRGHTVPVDNGVQTTDVDVFFGIPFGSDTSGSNRFMRPQPPVPWDGIFEADTMGPRCPQIGIGDRTMSEDCLQLNIFTPANASVSGSYPVMVWVFGGGFFVGSPEAFPGHFLASRDVVVVTINHRVTVFGFASTQTPACPGNAGMWDQKLALEFVQNNIANFGGDPNQVTMFGQSSGSCSAGLASVSPQSKDLFHQAIMESGTETSVGVYLPPESRPQDQLRLLADDLDCNLPVDEDMIACLQEVPWEDFFNKSDRAGFGFGTVYDGFMPPEDSYLPASPRELRSSGDTMSGPVIVGFNHDEAAVYMPGIIPESMFGCCNRTYFSYVLESRVVDMLTNPSDNVTREKLYRALDYNYTPWPELYDNWANRDAFIQMFTDRMFLVDFELMARQHMLIAPTYTYVFNYRGRNATLPEWMGVPHGNEIAFVWGMTLLPNNPAVLEDMGMAVPTEGFTDEDVRFTLYIQEMFTNFAKTGNPTPSPVDDPLGGSTVWSQYTEDVRNVLVISNTSSTIQDGYRDKERAFFEQYVPYLESSEPSFINDAILSLYMGDFVITEELANAWGQEEDEYEFYF